MIVLIGMPGCGKSTVGRELAHRLKLPSYDSDAEIERRIGGRIRDFFAREGEAAFRDLEQQVITELTAHDQGVLATGGGAVLRSANRERIKACETVIYLTASPEFLYRRLRRDRKRPLLQVADPLAKLQALFDERDPLYRECADFHMAARRASRSHVVNRILMQLELKPSPHAQA